MAIPNWRSPRNLACVERIEVFFLPSCSPDLQDPMSAGEPAHRAEQMKQKVLAHLRSLQKLPARLSYYFRKEQGVKS